MESAFASCSPAPVHLCASNHRSVCRKASLTASPLAPAGWGLCQKNSLSPLPAPSPRGLPLAVGSPSQGPEEGKVRGLLVLPWSPVPYRAGGVRPSQVLLRIPASSWFSLSLWHHVKLLLTILAGGAICLLWTPRHCRRYANVPNGRDCAGSQWLFSLSLLKASRNVSGADGGSWVGIPSGSSLCAQVHAAPLASPRIWRQRVSCCDHRWGRTQEHLWPLQQVVTTAAVWRQSILRDRITDSMVFDSILHLL